MFSVNYLGTGLSVLFSVVLGFFWYSVFGKGLQGKELIKALFLSLLSAVFKSVIFYVFLEAAFLFKGPSLESAFFLSGVLWVGASFPLALDAWAFERLGWRQVLTKISYEAIRLAGLAAIFWLTRPA